MTKTDIEKRVARAYEDLRPAPGVGDEIASQLTDARVRPRRVAPYVWVLGAAAALMVAVLFVVERGTSVPTGLADAEKPKDAVEVRVTADGRVLVRLADLDGKWGPVTLDGLAAYLRKAAKTHDKWDEVRVGVLASRLKVILRADANTPWRHLQWIMLVCAQEKLPRLQLGKIPIPLPTDKGIGAKPRNEIKVQVVVLARARGQVVFRFGDRETAKIEGVAEWLRAAKKATGNTNVPVIGEIKASHRVPAATIQRLLEEYEKAGVGPVDFYGTAIPTAKQRAALRLPFPKAAFPGWRPRPPEAGQEEDIVEEEIVEEPIEEDKKDDR